MSFLQVLLSSPGLAAFAVVFTAALWWSVEQQRSVKQGAGFTLSQLTVAASFTDVVEKDPDGDCRRLALQNLLLLENLKKKLQIVPS